MGKLTDAKLRSMKPNGKVQKESDGDWLYAYMGPKSKSISWQLGYRFENKQKVLTLGRYPEVSLAEARKKCLEARELLADGHDPGLVKKRGFKFRVQHPVLGYWRLLKILHRVS